MTLDQRNPPLDDLRRLKLLLVDPNAYLRGVLADSLRRLQLVNIAGAANAVEALSVGRVFKPDIIIVDWDAGKVSGLDFTRDIRRNTSGLPRETPIILLAAHVDHIQLMAARQAGINEFLLKPISAQGVLSRIEEIALRPRRFIVSRTYVGPCRRRRDDPFYAGPWRRLTDTPEQRIQAAPSRENLDRLCEIVDGLGGYLDRGAKDPIAAIRGIYKFLNEHLAEIRTLKDDVIVRVWSTAITYIEGVGMTAHYDPEVIRHHIQTIRRIIDMPEEALLHRAAVANELKRLVMKKINQDRDADAPMPSQLSRAARQA